MTTRKKPVEPITHDEWQDALNAAHLPPETESKALTVAELAEKYGLADRTVRVKIARLVREGKVIAIKKRMPKITGHTQLVPAYILKTTLG